MNTTSIPQKNNREKGVALLFVVLLTSVLFLVAIGITNISYKELAFSLQARDSDLAFFAADTGIECGLYLNKTYPALFPAAGATTIGPGSGTFPMTCNSNTLHTAIYGGASTFAIDLGTVCAQVSIDKTVPIIVSGVTHHITTITSKGYNTKITSAVSPTCLPTVGPLPVNLVNRVLQASFVQ